MTRKVCIVGSVNMDLVVRAPRLPAPGETVMGGAFAMHPGGKGANQAVAAARMGAPVTMIGCVGEDEYSRRMLEVLAREGIDVSGVQRRAGAPTGVALITVAEGGQDTIVVAPGANATVSIEQVETARGAIEAADVLLMQLEVPVEAVLRAATLAHAAGKIVMLNAAPAEELPVVLLRLLDVLIVNQNEAGVICEGVPEAKLLAISRAPIFRKGTRWRSTPHPETNPDVCRLLARLANLGARSVVLTLGDQGAAWLRRRGVGMIDSFPVDAVDSVGAGDAFCGTLAATWPDAPVKPGRSADAGKSARPETLSGAAKERASNTDERMEWENRVYSSLMTASAAGALATTKHGAIPSLPTADEVRALLREHGMEGPE